MVINEAVRCMLGRVAIIWPSFVVRREHLYLLTRRTWVDESVLNSTAKCVTDGEGVLIKAAFPIRDLTILQTGL